MKTEDHITYFKRICGDAAPARSMRTGDEVELRVGVVAGLVTIECEANGLRIAMDPATAARLSLSLLNAAERARS